jgi:sigma-B regulation protein RsbU (phosphoserine phosphatase)
MGDPLITVERTIHPGDAVVLFTDGIYEVAGSGQEEFGEQRLLAAAQQYTDLPLQDLFPSLLTEARQFALEGAFDDDVCLVGFRLSELLQR